MKRIPSFFSNIRFYIINRFIDRTHLLPSRLKPGAYHELDERMLHCLFDSLQDFVEGELAWLHAITHSEAFVEKTIRRRPYRNKEAGLAHLAWEKSLTNDDGSPCGQALAAQEILRLYDWWVNRRPKRIDPSTRLDFFIEKAHEAEDTEMMTALIKIRGSLWT